MLARSKFSKLLWPKLFTLSLKRKGQSSIALGGRLVSALFFLTFLVDLLHWFFKGWGAYEVELRGSRQGGALVPQTIMERANFTCDLQSLLRAVF